LKNPTRTRHCSSASLFNLSRGRYFAHVRAVYNRLNRTYPPSRLGNKDDPFDELVYLILSVKTQETRYNNTFERLRELIPSWEYLLSTDPVRIEKVIAYGGLARSKANTFIELAHALHRECGNVSLDFLQRMPTHEAEKFLQSLPGVGLKVARCVLMYSLNREVFPVDTHCFRIAKRIGWIPSETRLTEKSALSIEKSVPASIRSTLHIRLVQHGRATCKPVHLQCSQCCIASFCRSSPTKKKAELESSA